MAERDVPADGVRQTATIDTQAPQHSLAASSISQGPAGEVTDSALSLPSNYLSNEHFLHPFRPRSFSTPTIVERQVALELRGISDSFNSLYSGDRPMQDSEEDDDEPVAQRMNRRASLPNMNHQRRGSLLQGIFNRYFPSRNHLQPPMSDVAHIRFNIDRDESGVGRIPVESSVDDDGMVTFLTRRGHREHRQSVGAVAEEVEESGAGDQT